MKKVNKIFLYTAVATMMVSGAVAVTLTNQTVSARVVKALSMTNTTQLNFGDFIPSSSTAETITLSGSGSSTPTFTASSGITLISTGPTKTPAQFAVSGEGGYSYTVTVPSSVTLTGSVSGTMTFGTITVQAGTSRTLSGTTGTVGSDTIYLNGVLNVAANQAPGTYSGTYTITANY